MPATSVTSGSTTSSRRRRYRRMPAIRRRRGSAAILTRGFVGASPFCSGGNLRTGSANLLLLFERCAGRILDRVADVLLDGLELRQQPVGVGGIDAFEGGRRQFGAQSAELAEQRAR